MRDLRFGRGERQLSADAPTPPQEAPTPETALERDLEQAFVVGTFDAGKPPVTGNRAARRAAGKGGKS